MGVRQISKVSFALTSMQRHLSFTMSMSNFNTHEAHGVCSHTSCGVELDISIYPFKLNYAFSRSKWAQYFLQAPSRLIDVVETSQLVLETINSFCAEIFSARWAMWICWDWDEFLYSIVVGNVHIRHRFLTIVFAKWLGLEMGMPTLLSNCLSLVKQCTHVSYFARIEHWAIKGSCLQEMRNGIW